MTIKELRKIINSDWYADEAEVLLEINIDISKYNGQCFKLSEVYEENTAEVRLVGSELE